jgi:hypothetical protein
VDALVPLVAGLLSWLRAIAGSDVCPGDWAWAVTVFGVLVGLLPTAGALTVIALRRRAAEHGRRLSTTSAVLIGVGSCWLGVWALFQATGQVFQRGGRASGLGRADRVSLTQLNCFGMSQRAYLGSGSVSQAFGDDVVRGAVFFLPLVVFPLAAAFLVWTQARLALRGGPRWPARLFALSLLAVAVTTGALPAGATAQLWTGVGFGSLCGVLPVLLVRPSTRSARDAQVPAPGGGPARPAESGRSAGSARRVRPDQSAGPAAPARSGRPFAADQLSGVGQRAGAPRSTKWAGKRAGMAAGLAAVRTAAGRWTAGPAGRWFAGPAERLRARLADTGSPGLAQPPPRAPVVPAPRMPLGSAAPRGTMVEQTPCPGARFELVRSVGRGGFGGVWLAVDHRTGSQVALKAAHVPDRDTELRLRREARALGSVRHPHCVRILDLVDSRTDPGLAGHLRGLVIVMEYLPGRTLADILTDLGPMDDRTAGRLWLLIAGALSAAHQQGVLHRDVKPGNVVVDPRGDPHLIDFGIARARGDATLTLAGMVIGTPDFLAPEVARGEPASPASDCWQLAATMSFALTGKLPRGDCTDAVAALRSAAAATTPRYLPVRSVHHQLARACLAPDPAARPTLAEVRRVLEQQITTSGGPGRSVSTRSVH